MKNKKKKTLFCLPFWCYFFLLFFSAFVYLIAAVVMFLILALKQNRYNFANLLALIEVYCLTEMENKSHWYIIG